MEKRLNVLSVSSLINLLDFTKSVNILVQRGNSRRVDPEFQKIVNKGSHQRSK